MGTEVRLTHIRLNLRSYYQHFSKARMARPSKIKFTVVYGEVKQESF